MRKRFLTFLCLFVVAGGLLLSPQNANAQRLEDVVIANLADAANIKKKLQCGNFNPGVNFDGSPLKYPNGITTAGGLDISGQDIIDSSISRPGIVFKIVTCVEELLEDAFGDSIVALNAELQDFVAILIVLYVMIFGVRLALVGISNIKVEVFTVLFKVLLVFTFVISFGVSDYIMVWKFAQLAIATGMMTAIDSGGVCNAGNVWLDMDCIIAQILGANAGNAYSAGNSGNVAIVGGDNGFPGEDIMKSFASFGQAKASPLTLFKSFGALLSSDYGIFYGLLIIFIAILLFFVVAQIAVVYITSIFALLFAGLIAPLMIPMVLFQKTERYFNSWLRLLFSYFLPPVLMVGYLAFTVSVLNYILLRECVEKDDSGNTVDTYKCGLIFTFEDLRKGMGVGRAEHVLSNAYVTTMEIVAKEGKTDEEAFCDPLVKNSEVDCVGSFNTYFLWDKDQKEAKKKEYAYMRELIVVTLSLMMVMGFMVDVLKNAAMYVGTSSHSISNRQPYFRALSEISATLSGGKK